MMESSTKSVIVAVFGFWIFGVLLGGIWGTYRSNKANAYSYIASHIRDSTESKRVSIKGSQAIVGLALSVKNISLEAGPFVYCLSKGDSLVRRSNNPLYNPSDDESPRTEFTLASFTSIASVLALVGVKLPTIASSAEALAQSNKWYIVLGVAGGALGFGIGYYFTYNERVDFTSAEFQKAVNDLMFWRGQFERAEQRLYGQLHSQ
jgi:hypothetical protein